MDYTTDDVRALAAKIDGLDLKSGEVAALAALLAAADAATNDVEGHGWEEGVAAATGGPAVQDTLTYGNLGARLTRVLEPRADGLLGTLFGGD